MPIKVLFVASSLRIGGSERVLIEILKRLDRGAFEPHLALLACEGGFLEHVPPDIPVHWVGARRARTASLPLARLCWSLRPQAILSFAAQVNAALILAKPLLPRGTRVLVREGANVTLAEVAGCVRRAAYRTLYRHADAVICQSDDMIRRMVTCFGLPRHKLFRIYNPVDPVELEQRAEGGFTYKGPRPHLIAVGRFAHVKGMDLLIRAMAVIVRDYPAARLTLVGGGPLETDLRELARSTGVEATVDFMGYQNNPYPFIRAADLLVIPSRNEALPNVALEALALGIPVVATDCPGGIREIAQCTKRLVLAGVDADALATAIKQAIVEMPKHESHRSQEADFLREFSPGRIIPLYEELIGHASPI